jgi:hypothetical protein
VPSPSRIPGVSPPCQCAGGRIPSPPAASAAAVLGELFPHLSGVIVDGIESTPAGVVVAARYQPAQAQCPACRTWSSRVHGSYVRQVRDLPAGGRPVVIRLAVRRFVCVNEGCVKATFAGQADGLTARCQRWSIPLAA